MIRHFPRMVALLLLGVSSAEIAASEPLVIPPAPVVQLAPSPPLAREMYVLVKPGTSLKSATAAAQPADSLNPYCIVEIKPSDVAGTSFYWLQGAGEGWVLESEILNPDDSIEEINRLLAANPHSQQFYIVRGKIFLGKGLAAGAGDASEPHFEQAARDFGEAVLIDPSAHAAYSARATRADHTHDIDGALADFTVAIQLLGFAPDSTDMRDAHIGRGWIYSEQGQLQKNREWLERAVTDFNQALAISPKHFTAYDLLQTALKAARTLPATPSGTSPHASGVTTGGINAPHEPVYPATPPTPPPG